MISIQAGDATVVLDPERGGRIAGIDVGEHALLVAAAPDRGPMQWGSFPMVPWAGRVRQGRFTFHGRPHELALDPLFDLAPHAIHGTGYRQAWDVDDVFGEVDRQRLTMRCDLAWELGGHAWQQVSVGERVVSCVLGVTAGAHAMPAEVGWHPWFVKPEALVFDPSSMYLRDGEGIPTGALVAPPPGPWDDCFLNSQPVELQYPDLVVTVRSDCDHWVVYDETPHATCVEPQSGPPDAFNLRPRVLEPGEQLVRTMTITW